MRPTSWRTNSSAICGASSSSTSASEARHRPRREAADAAARLIGVLAGILLCGAAGAQHGPVDLVLVLKSERRMYLISAGNIVREYPVALGGNPVGHKQQEGDRRTPEGRYVLDWTDGCIALDNRDMEETWEMVEVGTRIDIMP